MTDQELLERAAKAAGYEAIRPASFGADVWMAYGEGEWQPWNPLTEDGDALRLAVKLRLIMHVWDDGETVSAAKTLPGGNDPASSSPAWHAVESHSCGDDLYAAARRAITTAAASLADSRGDSQGGAG